MRAIFDRSQVEAQDRVVQLEEDTGRRIQAAVDLERRAALDLSEERRRDYTRDLERRFALALQQVQASTAEEFAEARARLEA